MNRIHNRHIVEEAMRIWEAKWSWQSQFLDLDFWWQSQYSSHCCKRKTWRKSFCVEQSLTSLEWSLIIFPRGSLVLPFSVSQQCLAIIFKDTCVFFYAEQRRDVWGDCMHLQPDGSGLCRCLEGKAPVAGAIVKGKDTWEPCLSWEKWSEYPEKSPRVSFRSRPQSLNAVP